MQLEPAIPIVMTARCNRTAGDLLRGLSDRLEILQAYQADRPL